MFVQLFCTFLVLLLFNWVRRRRKKLHVFLEMGIPGPEPNVFFGNFLEIFMKGTNVCQSEWIRKYGKILGYYHGLRPVLLVTDIELLRKVLIKDFHKFTDRPLIFREILASDDMRNNHIMNLKSANWKIVRSLITPTFTTKKMKLMSPIMQEAIDILLEKLENKCQSGEIFDASDLYKSLTMDIIGRTAFGIYTNVQMNSKDPFIKLTNYLLHEPFSYFFILMSSSFPIFSPIFRALRTIIGAIDNKFSNPIEDIESRCEAIIRARLQNPSQTGYEHGRQCSENLHIFRDTGLITTMGNANSYNILKRVDLLQLMIDTRIKDSSKVEDDTLIAGEDTEKQDSNELENSSLNNKDTKSLSIAEIVANTFIFLIAGYETTSTALAFSTLVLANFPEIQEKIRKEIDEVIEKEGQLDYGSVQKLPYFDSVFSEVLRLYPPVHMFVNREATEDINYGHIRIRKGMSVQVPVYLLHRDPDYWPEPEKFIPERFSPENRTKINSLAWQPFGAGPRNCVGMRFAQMEAKLTLAEILHKYKFIRCHRTDTLPLDLEVLPLLLRPKYGVPIRVVSRDTPLENL